MLTRFPRLCEAFLYSLLPRQFGVCLLAFAHDFGHYAGGDRLAVLIDRLLNVADVIHYVPVFFCD